MNGFWGTIRSYILWQHERGTLHYDIMVTLILIFVFLSLIHISIAGRADLHGGRAGEHEFDNIFGG